MSTARIKIDLERFIGAAEAIHHGEYLVAERLAGFGGLPLVIFNAKLTQRLTAAYKAAIGKRLPRVLLVKAHAILSQSNTERSDPRP